MLAKKYNFFLECEQKKIVGKRLFTIDGQSNWAKFFFYFDDVKFILKYFQN